MNGLRDYIAVLLFNGLREYIAVLLLMDWGVYRCTPFNRLKEYIAVRLSKVKKTSVLQKKKVWINQQAVTVCVGKPFWPSGHADIKLTAWDGGGSIPRIGSHFVSSFVDPGH